MKPSDKIRRLNIILSSPRFLGNCFKGFGILIAIVAVIIGFFNYGKTTTIHASVNGEPQLVTVSALLLSGIILLFALIFFLVGLLFVPLVMKIITSGEEKYPVSEIKVSRENLLAEAETSTFQNDLWQAEVNGNWIDVSWNWKNYVSLNFTGILKSQGMFYKLFLIHDDYTYDELDMQTTADINLSAGKISLGKQFRMGRIANQTIEYTLGKDLQNDELGVVKCRLNTLELTNYMHEWFAQRGYSPRK